MLPEEEQQPQQSLDEDPMVHGTVTETVAVAAKRPFRLEDFGHGPNVEDPTDISFFLLPDSDHMMTTLMWKN